MTRALPDQEGAALLRWLADGMLTQLGHVTRHRDGSVTEALGICRATDAPLLSDASYARAFAWFDKIGTRGEEAVRIPLIVKANRIARSIAGCRSTCSSCRWSKAADHRAVGPCRGLDQRGAGRHARSRAAHAQPA
jgi:hypothetical protein